MAKRTSSSSSKKKVEAPEVAKVTPVRKTVAPRKSAPKTAAPVITHGLICERAYFISISGNGGSESDNYFRAEKELKSELGL